MIGWMKWVKCGETCFDEKTRHTQQKSKRRGVLRLAKKTEAALRADVQWGLYGK